MTPRHGEIGLADMGMAAKTRDNPADDVFNELLDK